MAFPGLEEVILAGRTDSHLLIPLPTDRLRQRHCWPRRHRVVGLRVGSFLQPLEVVSAWEAGTAALQSTVTPWESTRPGMALGA